MPEQVVFQRIRNRIIENLEWIVDTGRGVPQLGLNELINFWDDWAGPVWDENRFPQVVFSRDEIRAIHAVSLAIAAFADETAQSIPDTDAIVRSQSWTGVVEQGRKALSELAKRGRLSEEFEEKV